MFDLFRSRDKVVRILLGGLLLLVALSMLTYLVPSYNMGGNSSDMVVAEIGKDTITLPEVQQIVQMNMRGRQIPAALMPNYIPQFINSMVTERALAFEAKRLGYKVSNQDLADGIRQTLPQLWQDGKFAGNDAYAAVLAQQNLTIPQFEDDMARQLLVNKIRDVAMEGTIVTPQEIEQEYKRRNDKVKLQWVKIAGDKYRSDIQVTPDELRKYYEANKPSYQIPEKRDLGILIIDQAKLEQTIQPTDADLLRVYNENKDAYRLPERVNVQHILLKTNDKDPKSDAAVKARAEDLVKQLRAGANFSEMAKKYSEDPGSASKGGEYDGVVRGQMVPEFEKAAFSLKVGEISDPVKTSYGYHILKVLAHEQAQLKPFAEVKAQLAADYKKQRVNDLMQQLSDKVQAALTKDPLHPEKVATDLGVQYVKADNVGAGDPLPQVGVNKDFEESISSLKKGEVSQPVVLTGNTKIAMAVCTNDYPAHPAAFEEVQGKVRDALINDKLNKLVDQKATQLVEKARANGGDLQAAAKAMGLEVKTSDAVDRAGAIEGLGSAGMFPDAFSKPAGTIIGPNGTAMDTKVVCKVVDKIPADMSALASQRTAIRDELKSEKERSRATLFEEGVRDTLTREGKIKIHQDVIDRLLASYHS
ncbi:MAG TPA: peptidylprolyl isomerase [Bryobacteraceae bacterium]|nr:peptidylprolyl isomerase [Bryobacteraceae bacterium]